jgi:excinuclease ABC subunit C
VTLTVPRRGAKRGLVEMAAENAAETLASLKAQWEADTNKHTQALAELQAALGLAAPPNRIECFDISNTQGTAATASLVVFEQGAPRKGHYRHFSIKSVQGPDDFASMREVLTRRFRRWQEEQALQGNGPIPGAAAEAMPADAEARNGETELASAEIEIDPAGVDGPSVPEPAEATPGKRKRSARAPGHKVDESFARLPDLLIIDGGKGQLGVAVEVLAAFGLTDQVPVVGLAKQQEEIFLPRQPVPVLLPRRSQGLYLVQRVRDEAHRFALSHHRARRGKIGLASQLDAIPGIGPTRRRALLRRFGSLDGIRAASAADLLTVPGMTRAAAEAVKAHL